VRQLPRSDLAVAAAAATVAAGEGTDILLDTTQPGVRYQLARLDGDAARPLGDLLGGAGEPLRLPTGPLQADARLRVRALRTDAPDGQAWLTAEVQVQVLAPPPTPPAPPP